MKKVKLVSLFCCLSLYCSSQDTIVVVDRQEFEEIIRIAYADYTQNLTSSIKGQIDSLFKTFDFSTSLYRCQYYLGFTIELDSCGNILGCTPFDRNRTHDDLIEFEKGVVSIILNSQWKIQNTFGFDDTYLWFLGANFSFEISCYPSEIIYYGYENSVSDKKIVIKYISGNGPIYFDGLRFDCEM